MHIDPNGTSAWNASLDGLKRWVLISPAISKETVIGKKFLKEGEDDEAINWFLSVWPKLRRTLHRSEF